MFFHRHSALSHRQHDDDLGNDDAQEHAERIDRGVGNGGFVARQSVVDIVEGDGVGHSATEHTSRRGETLATPLHGDDADDDDGEHGDEHAESNPRQGGRLHDGGDEVASGIKTEAGQIHGEAEASQHEVGTGGGVGHHVETRTVSANEDAHHDGAAGETEAHWRAEPNTDGDAAQEQTKHDAHEDGDHVRLVEMLDGVAELIGHFFDAVGLTDDGDAVAHAEHEVGGGHELYASTLHAADIDAIAVAELQCAEVSSVDFRACDENALRDEFGVERIPVDVLLVPVGLVASSEKHGELLDKLALRDDEDAIVFLKQGFGRWENHLSVAPESRYDKLGPFLADASHLIEFLMEDGGVAYEERGDEGLVVFAIVFCRTLTPRKPSAHDDEGNDDANHSQGIGHGASEGRC